MLRQVSSYMIANVIAAIFGFALVVVFTRILSPHEYGVYVVGMSIAMLVSTVLFNWIKVSLLRFSSEGDAPDLRVTALISFGVLTLFSPLVAELVHLFSGISIDYMLEALCVAVGIGLFEFTQEVFRARQQTGLYATSMIMRGALAFAISGLLVGVFGFGGSGLLLGIAGGYFTTLVIFAPRLWHRPLHKFDPQLLGMMLRFGLPMTISGTVFSLHSLLDRMVLVAFMNETAAGVYGAAGDLVRQIILMLGVAIGSAIVPIAIKLYSIGDKDELDGHLRKSLELLLGLLLPAVAGIAITAEKFSAIILGEEFRDAAAMLIPIIVFAWLFRSISYQYIHISFQIARKPALMGVQGVLILAANIIGMAILVPRYELAGAAYSLVISEIFGVFVGFCLARRAYPLPFAAVPVIKICTATALMAVPTYAVLHAAAWDDILGTAIAVTTGVLSYGVAVVLLDIAGMRGVLLRRIRTA